MVNNITPVVPWLLQPLPPGSIHLDGPIHERIKNVANYAFDGKILSAMTDVFKKRPNGFAIGEFWGKTVRALCHHYQYSLDPRLKDLLDSTLADLASTQDANGCISGYKPEKQPYNSDMWDRKYVLVGLLNGFEVTRDPKMLEAAMRMADHLLTQVGPGTKVRVCETGFICQPPFHEGWQGMESSSILEPMVRLYALTGKAAYLDFAKNIVEVEGGAKRHSIFEAALAGKDACSFGGNSDPELAVAHAYNIISCFEGLTEYYRMTGMEKYHKAAVNLYENVIAKEDTVIGGACGLGGVNNGLSPTEQFNHSAFFQTCPVRDGMEGCTIARWMAYCRMLLMLSGDTRFADRFELSMYNALLGCIRPDGVVVDYHTHLNGVRPAQVNYHMIMGGRDITCCYFNVADTLAMIPSTMVMRFGDGVAVNLFIPSTATVRLADGNEVVIGQKTDYPRTGEVELTIAPSKAARFPVRLRVPEWSRETSLKINGKPSAVTPGQYAVVDREWAAGDRIELSLDMRCRRVQPPEGTPEKGRNFQALVRGPVVLARDKRLGGDLRGTVDIKADVDGYVSLTPMTPACNCRMQFSVPTDSGTSFPVMDFESSGSTWTPESERVTWIPGPSSSAK